MSCDCCGGTGKRERIRNGQFEDEPCPACIPEVETTRDPTFAFEIQAMDRRNKALVERNLKVSNGDMFIGEGEERITNAETGGEKGQKPERYDLIPWAAMDEVARVYGYGARKYEPRNWQRGYSWSLSIGAAFRHLSAFAAGENLDSESQLPHLAAAVFHMLALITFAQTHPELDDRATD